MLAETRPVQAVKHFLLQGTQTCFFLLKIGVRNAKGEGKTLNANLLLTLCPSSSSCSEEEPEGTLPKDKLITLCKYEPILKWMRSCDHILYQALVEILIPDVLRPVPSEYPQPHLS